MIDMKICVSFKPLCACSFDSLSVHRTVRSTDCVVVRHEEALLRTSINQYKPARTQYVVVPHEEGLVDLRLPEPALLLGGEEHLDGHPLAPPAAHPHLPVAPLPHLLHHLDLLGDGALHLCYRQRRLHVNVMAVRLTGGNVNDVLALLKVVKRGEVFFKIQEVCYF